MKIKIIKPKSIKSFLEALQTVKTQKKKAANLLFDEIEHDVKEKEKFVLEQTQKIREMNENYLTMLDYEKVLENVQFIIPQLGAGRVRASMGGGAHVDDEDPSARPVFSINLDQNRQSRASRGSDAAPLMEAEVNIAHVAGTIELEEQPRLKKLIFRATRGKALTYFREYSLPKTHGQKAKTKAVYIVVF